MILALEVLGSWTFVAVREMNSNLEKIDESTAAHEVEGVGERLTLSAVLDWEVAEAIHQPGGDVVEDSAANGLLWLLRFLRLWRELWREPRPSTFGDALNLAYEKSIKPYHGWVVQRTFALSTSVVPSWPEVHDRLEAFDEDGEEGLLRSIAALDPVLDRIEEALRKRGLYDERKV